MQHHCGDHVNEGGGVFHHSKELCQEPQQHAALLIVNLHLCCRFQLVLLCFHLLLVYFVDYVVGYDVEEEEFIPKAIIFGCDGKKYGSSKNDYMMQLMVRPAQPQFSFLSLNNHFKGQ